MTEIKRIYEKIYSENLTQNLKQFISYYEENKRLIEIESASTTDSDYNRKMRIISDYAICLSNYGNSNKAIKYLDKSVYLFKNSSVDDLRKIPMYENLIWTRGNENYNQKNYNLAIKDFQYLVDNYPENDKYKSWLIGLKTSKIKKYSNYIWIIFFTCVIWTTFFNVKDQNLNFTLLTIGVISFIIGIGFEVYDFMVKRKIQRKKSTRKIDG